MRYIYIIVILAFIIAGIAIPGNFVNNVYAFIFGALSFLGLVNLVSPETPIGKFVYRKYFEETEVVNFFNQIIYSIKTSFIIIACALSISLFDNLYLIRLCIDVSILLLLYSIVFFTLKIINKIKYNYSLEIGFFPTSPIKLLINILFFLMIMYGWGCITSMVIPLGNFDQYFQRMKEMEQKFPDPPDDKVLRSIFNQSKNINEYVFLFDKFNKIYFSGIRFFTSYQTFGEKYDLWGPIVSNPKSAQKKSESLFKKSYNNHIVGFNEESTKKIRIGIERMGQNTNRKYGINSLLSSPELDPQYIAVSITEKNLKIFSSAAVATSVLGNNLRYYLSNKTQQVKLIFSLILSILCSYFLSMKLKKYNTKHDPGFQNKYSLFFTTLGIFLLFSMFL